MKATLKYMRAPTSESNKFMHMDQHEHWNLKSISCSRTPLSSSPVLSCPPSWLDGDYAPSSKHHETENHDIDDAALEVPFSSSPPDLIGSSPPYFGTKGSGDLSTSPSSISNSISFSRRSLSLIELPTRHSGDNFGKRLHQLLLALKERECERGADYADSLSGAEPSDCECYSTMSSSSCSTNQLSRRDSGYRSNEMSISGSLLGNSEEYNTCMGSRFSELTTDPNVTLQSSEENSVNFLRNKRNEPPFSGQHRAYRLIKRAQSYEAFLNASGHASKRQKIIRYQDPYQNDHIYATRTASLRRADSLKSAPRGHLESDGELAPTVPATPVLIATPKSNGRNPAKSSEANKVLLKPVPIIAPPEDHVAKLPLNSYTLAKIRLRRYLEREASSREMDGLPNKVCQHPPSWMVEAAIEEGLPLDHEEKPWADVTILEWEVVLGIGKKRREAAIDWLLDVLPIQALARAPSPESLHSQPSICSYESHYYSSSSSPHYTTDTPEPKSGSARPISNLQDQLENSPETRFHAVWMFLRYFNLTMSPDSNSRLKAGHPNAPMTISRHNSVDQQGLDLVVWDIAVACLAVSVKFHRDFLDPLYPVFAHEYVLLAPHVISLEELESAHRDILSTFDYRLGITPQPVMDELWLALSSLRSILAFPEGWENAKLEAWARLFATLDEPDVQQFPVSILTVVALMDGIIESIVDNHRREEFISIRNTTSPATTRYPKPDRRLQKKFVKKAKYAAEGVFCDIQALTGITDVEKLCCAPMMWDN